MSENPDLIVCDGFTGNILLKSIEGTLKSLRDNIRNETSSSFLFKLCKPLIGLTYLVLKRKVGLLNPKKYNAGLLLGLNGLVVKAHGNVKYDELYSAIDIAHKMAKQKIHKQVEQTIGDYIEAGECTE